MSAVELTDNSTSLRDLAFSDLWINDKGEAYLSEGKVLRKIEDRYGSDAWRLWRLLEDQSDREFPLEYDDVVYRVARLDGRYHTWWVLRRLALDVPPFDALGFPEPIVKRIRDLGRHDNPGGLVLVLGDTNNGKTWTVSSAMMSWLALYGGTCLTVEAPPELPLEGPHGEAGYCIQTRIQEHEIDIQVALSARCNPAYLMIGEVRFPKTARQTLNASLAGRIVGTTMHAATVEQGLLRFAELAASSDDRRVEGSGQPVEKSLDTENARHQLADALRVVIHQRLVRHEKYPRPLLTCTAIFCDGADQSAIAAHIRSGQFRQLTTIIERQQKWLRGT
jgi:twitching motility protein PilT